MFNNSQTYSVIRGLYTQNTERHRIFFDRIKNHHGISNHELQKAVEAVFYDPECDAAVTPDGVWVDDPDIDWTEINESVHRVTFPMKYEIR